MIILPHKGTSRIWLDIKRRFRPVDPLGYLAISASLLSVVGVVFGGYKQHQDVAIYAVLALSLLLTSHYCRLYFFERRQSEQVRETFKYLHSIVEHLRNSHLALNESGLGVKHGGKPGTHQWSEAYIERFEADCENVCKALHSALIALGYPIHAVCIKGYDNSSGSIHVVQRSHRRRKRQQTDMADSRDSNPFFCLLEEVHTNYEKHIQMPEIWKEKRNREPDCPRFVAIGHLNSAALPTIFSRIMVQNAKEGGCTPKEVLREEDFLAKLRQRVDGAYRSCMGILVASGAAKSGRVETDDYRGFIGIDSHNSGAWDFLQPQHVNLVASVADALYYPMAFYQVARGLSADAQQQLPI